MKPEVPSHHNLYLIRVFSGDGDSLMKVGYSSNINKRLYQYYSHNPMVEVLFTCHRDDAIEFESSFHRRHASVYMNEWYTVSSIDYILGIDYSSLKTIDPCTNSAGLT